MNLKMNEVLFLVLNLCSIVMGWSSCSFNDGSVHKTVWDNVTIQAECMYLTSPLEWDQFNPNTFDGDYHNKTKNISVTDLHLKRLFFSQLPPLKNSSVEHTINYWLVNGGGGSQYGMEYFGISMLKQIVLNKYHTMYPQTHPIMYLFQYRGAGMSIPSIHCHNATNWTGCAEELIQTTEPTSRTKSLEIINAITNQNIAQDLQYQIQYALNQSQATSQSTYIYGLSQGTGIIEYYLSVQSINSQLQPINGVILDGVMSIKDSDAAGNQIKTANDRFYLYLSKCQQDTQCSKAFSLVTGTDQDILSVTLRLQMLFKTNKTNPQCTSNLGLNSWPLFIQIGSQAIEDVTVRPFTVILIARLYRCSAEDQQVLSQAIPFILSIAQKESSEHLIDPPDAYLNDGAVLSITTIWSDFVGLTLNDSIKTNADFYNDFCVNSSVSNELYLAPTGILPLCNETKLSKYNYTLPSACKDILYSKNPRYWGQFQVNSTIFRSPEGGVLLFNGDLDFNSPIATAQQVQKFFEIEDIPTKLVAMKGLTHVTSIQSYTKRGGFESTTCTEQIIVQFLYQQELNLTLSNLNDTCNSQENLIGIDWFYKNPTVNQKLNVLFANSTSNYWGIDTEIDPSISIENQSGRLNVQFSLNFLSILFFYFILSSE